jgi:YegS/Rv2252/BmrU family lipid kinase
MYKKMMLIINPRAGRMQSRNNLFNIINLFYQNGYEVTVYPTQERSDATRIVMENAHRYDIITCCGGDGTLNEVISGLMHLESRPPLGYIPSGTTNDLATSLELNNGIMKAAQVIVSGTEYLYDIGSFNDRFFTYIAAFGAFTDVSYSTPQQTKNSLGHLAYILEGIKRLPEIRSYRLKIEYDGGVVEDDFVFGAVTNSTSMGGILKLSPDDVRLNDGLFEIILIKNPKNLLQLQRIVSGLLMQKYDDKDVLLLHSTKIRVTALNEIPWTLDGEDGGLHREIQMTNNNKAICFMINNKLEL